MGISYQEHLTTYIDVLGFRDLIDRSQNDSRLRSEIQDQLTQIVDWLGQFGLKGRFYSFNFSDLVVRVTSLLPGDDLADHLNREIFYIAERQFQMAMRGWFLRGAISVGPLAVGDGLVFGPALVRAHELENRVAGYPRIVIDPTLVESLKGTNQGWQDYKITDQDGIEFINYLFGAFLRRYSFPDDSEKNPWKALDDHRAACVEFLSSKSATDDLRVRQKAAWVSHYHNRVMEDLAARFSGREDPNKFKEHSINHPYLAT